jgi:hypothetical protein
MIPAPLTVTFRTLPRLTNSGCLAPLAAVSITNDRVQEIDLRLFEGFLLLLLASQSQALRSQSTTPQFFFNQASFPTAQYPRGVAIADMNGDGQASAEPAHLPAAERRQTRPAASLHPVWPSPPALAETCP